MTCFYELPDAGKEAIVFTQFVVREDAQLLYGFNNKQERTLFRELIKPTASGRSWRWPFSPVCPPNSS
ncbi:Holliday junction DNA helicase subunit RuvA [Enterobacter cloacae]|uniref:Holliday junction DNA helicase subunit RuvA n=1 Tax=Enterobacter cloacae TaxID=550 RepID=A0A377LY34_ENTCL|nr:Holliday junction DNA helicase subunit RuvA [Enterobacter cloacae]